MSGKKILFAALALYQLLRYVVAGLLVTVSVTEAAGAAVARSIAVFGSGSVILAILAFLLAVADNGAMHRALRIGKSVETAATLYALLAAQGFGTLQGVTLLGTVVLLDAIALLFLLLFKVDSGIRAAPEGETSAPVPPPSLPEVNTIEIEEE